VGVGLDGRGQRTAADEGYFDEEFVQLFAADAVGAEEDGVQPAAVLGEEVYGGVHGFITFAHVIW
jgi:hypothetical protein